jgi:hypothetical protein
MVAASLLTINKPFVVTLATVLVTVPDRALRILKRMNRLGLSPMG